MDVMKIESRFIKAAIGKLLKKALKKKLGCDLEIELGDITFTMDDKTAVIDAAVRAKARREEVKKLVDTLV